MVEVGLVTGGGKTGAERGETVDPWTSQWPGPSTTLSPVRSGKRRSLFTGDGVDNQPEFIVTKPSPHRHTLGPHNPHAEPKHHVSFLYWLATGTTWHSVAKADA
jgi:hypothetical protein